MSVWLPPVWVGVILAGLEAWTILLVAGNSGQLCDLGAITVGTILFMQGADEVNRRQPNDIRIRALQAVGIAFLVFLGLTWVIVKRASTGTGGWIWAEFGVLVLLSLPTIGVKKYLEVMRTRKP